MYDVNKDTNCLTVQNSAVYLFLNIDKLKIRTAFPVSST